MKKIIFFLFTLLIISSFFPPIVNASVTWADHSVIVSNDILTALETLTYDASVYYLAVVDVYNYSNVYVVSLVGLPSTADPQNWSITEAAWIGTAAVSDDYLQAALEGSALYDTLTAPVFDDMGGGTDIPIFPWEPGKLAYYGSRGVHDAGYGLTGWEAIDWVSGPSYGTNYYTNGVYASEDAQISYICRDSTSVAVVAGNFLYAHLKDNATLTIGGHIYKGVKFAELVTGSFSDTCGWASQQPGNYHVHWAFEPDSGVKRIEDWTLNITTQDWTKGTSIISIGDAMLSTGTTAVISDGDPSAEMDGSHVWDSPIQSIVSSVTKNIVPRFPEGQTRDIGTTYLNAAGVAIRIFYILIDTNFNTTLLRYFVIAMGILEPTRIIYALYKLVLKALPIAG